MSQYAYHCTNIDPEIIKKEGWKVGMGFTKGNFFDDLYKKYDPKVPVHITGSEREVWDTNADYIIKLDITGLDLYPDFGSLPDTGAFYDLDEQYFHWYDDSGIGLTFTNNDAGRKMKEYLELISPDEYILLPDDFTGEVSMRILGTACVDGSKLQGRIVSYMKKDDEMKINENTKITLTLKQIKKLVKEARKSSSKDFEIKDGVLVKYTGKGGDAVIPNGVTSIGDHAFDGCSSLTSITIPNSVTSIGAYAFHNCPGLTSVTIGNGVINIGKGAFYGCSGLTSVTIPDSVTTIEQDAFYRCSGLKSVVIPDSVSKIGLLAFSYCSDLESVTIGNGVKKVGWCAFSHCANLKSVTIGDGVKRKSAFNQDAFYDCPSLVNVQMSPILQGKINELKANPFYDTPWFEKQQSGSRPEASSKLENPKPKTPPTADSLKSFVEQFKDKDGVAKAYVSKAGNPCISVDTWDVNLPEEYVDFWYSFKCRRITNGSTERWVPREDADRELVKAVESVLGRFPFVTYNTPDGIDTLVFVLDFRDWG